MNRKHPSGPVDPAVPLGLLCLASLYPSLENATAQTGFGLGATGKVCRWLGRAMLSSAWLTGMCFALWTAALPAEVKLAVTAVLLAYTGRTIVFPAHVLLEYARLTPDTPPRPRALQMRRCFASYFRLHHNLDTLRKQPHLIVANYPNDRIESFVAWMLPCSFAYVVKQTVETNLNMRNRVHCIVVPESPHAYAATRDAVRDAFARGLHVFTYVNNPSPIDARHFDRYRTGMFRIAQDLGVPVTPMTVDQLEWHNGVLHEQTFAVQLGDPFRVTDPERDLQATHRWFKRVFARFQRLKN